MNWFEWLQLPFWVQSTILGVVGAFIGFLLVRVPPSWCLLRDCLYYDKSRPIAISGDLLRCAWVRRTKDSPKDTPKDLLRAVRLRVELELLTRPPESEPEKVQTWKRNLVTNLGKLWEGEPIPVDNCFALYHAREGIQRYFKVVEKVNQGYGFLRILRPLHFREKRQELEFLASVKVEEGFVATLHLLGGLLARMEEDWNDVLQAYGTAVTRLGNRNPLPSAPRYVQAFQWDCWLLWGPSIPMCTCDMWSAPVKALQYGYGDENNSLPLVFFEDQKQKLAEVMNTGRVKDPLALKMTVTGKPTSPKSLQLNNKTVSTAQQNICLTDNYEFLMRYESHVPLSGGREHERENRYYSAYVWLMFVVLRVDGTLLNVIDPVKPQEWWNMLPFFEHGNIGDTAEYEFFKEQVARKALSGIQRLLRDTETKNSGIRFEYACALDDSGCGKDICLLGAFPGQKIKDTLADLLENEFTNLRQCVVIPEKTRVGYSSCQLGQVIERFYQHVKA